jgi:hypothetical protein
MKLFTFATRHRGFSRPDRGTWGNGRGNPYAMVGEAGRNGAMFHGFIA